MKNVLYILLVFYLSMPHVSAQINTDSLFNVAVVDARNKMYKDALIKADKVLKIHPNRYDVMIFMANVCAWNGAYPQAISYINRAYALQPKNNELYDSWLNILLWSKDYKGLLTTIEIAKQNKYPNIYNMFLKQTIAYKNLGKYEQGIQLIEENKMYLDSADIKQLYIEMRMLDNTNVLSFYYGIDLLDDELISPQHLMFIDYAFKIKRHTVIPRLNFASRFGKNDFQPEIDYYHFFNKKRYVYSNFGMSINETIFPAYRAGLEYYFPIRKKSEASLGGRFLKSDMYEAIIATGNFNTYYKNMWFMIRPFYVFHDIKNTLSTVLGTRYYLKNPKHFWGFEFEYGNSPDERYTISQTSEQLLLQNYRLKFERNTTVFKIHELKLSTGYSYEEVSSDMFRNRLTFEVLLKLKL